MKYRIIPCITKKVQYRIQVRKFLFWSIYYTSSDYGYGTVIHVHTFDTVEEATEFAEETFGTKAKIVTYAIK